MASPTDQLGIYVDIGKNVVPRLNFTLGDHTTNVDIDVAGAANLGSSLLMASFLSSIGKGVPEEIPFVRLGPHTVLGTSKNSCFWGAKCDFGVRGAS